MESNAVPPSPSFHMEVDSNPRAQSRLRTFFCEWGQWSHWLNDVMMGVFKRYGYMVGRHPYWAIGIGLLFTLIFALGNVNFNFNNDYNLFIPQKTQGWRDQTTIRDQFGELAGGRPTATIVIPVADNVFEENVLQDMYLVDQRIQSVQFNGGKTFEDVCDIISPENPTCAMKNFFQILGLNTQQDISDNIDNIPQMVQDLPDSVTENLVGGLQYNSSGALVGAAALLFVYVGTDDPKRVGEVEAWEEAVFPVLEDESGKAKDIGYNIYYFNQWGTDQESLKLVMQEVPLIVGTIVIILVYMCVILGERPFLKSRILLGSSCILTVVASLGVGFGIACYMGLEMTLLAPLVIFILLGVGVDDMIIIVDCFQATKQTVKPFTPMEDESEEDRKRRAADIITERIAVGLAHAAYAISITSVTSAVAFLFSALIDFRAIRYFCLLGAFGIVGVYVLQLTIFAGFLVLDERRIESRRYDILPCIKAGPDNTLTKDVDFHENRNGYLHIEEKPQASGGRMERFMTEYLAWYISDKRIAAIIVLLFFGGTGLAIYSMLGISTNADNIAFYEDDSFVKLYYANSQKYFSTGLSPCYFYFQGEEIDYPSLVTQNAFQNLINESLQLPFVYGPPSFWLNDLYLYMNYTNKTLTETNFYSELNEFLVADIFNYTDDDGVEQQCRPKDYQKYIRFKDETNTTITYTIFSMFASWPTDTQTSIEQMGQLRDLLPDRVFPPLPPPGTDDLFEARGVGFVWSNEFTSADRDSVMTNMIIQNLTYAALGVTAVLFFMCHPGLVILILFSIVMIDIDLLGLMAAWGVVLDISAFIVLAMAIGLSVDYVVHIGHAYMRQFKKRPTHTKTVDSSDPLLSDEEDDVLKGSARDRDYQRLKSAFKEIGTSVLNGGLTTFLGISLLALAHSPGFRTFFRILFGTVTFGLIHGLLFAPAVLTLFSPLFER